MENIESENNKNILIVDDEPITGMVLKKHLTNEGYEVVFSNSAIKGTEILSSRFFPLVITDISMPEMGGLAFLKWINENSPRTDVVLMTGFGTKEIKEAARQRGAVNFFEKPIDLKKLAEFVKSKFNNQKFTGSIREISLPEFIHMFILSNKKRVITITDGQTNEKGTIFIHEGHIVDAQFGDLSGEEAFFHLMLLTNGSFEDVEWHQPHKFTISKAPDVLISEAVKLKEHKKLQINDPHNTKIIRLKNEKKILVVDDDMLTRLIIEKYLNQHNYNARAVASAIEGQELLTKENFDLVITDINMPGISGIDFLIWIKNHFPRTKVIIMTAFSSEATRKFVNQNGAVNYLEKPLDLRELDNFITNKLLDNNFSGNVRDIALLDYIKVVSFGNSAKKISISDPVLNQHAFLFIKEGNIIHAEYGSLHGEEAFYKILKMQYGIFNDVPWTDPLEESIKRPFEDLLIKAEIITAEENINKKLKLREERHLIRAGILPVPFVEKKMDLVSLNNIDDDKLGVYGLVIGRSNKEQVSEVMKNYSKTDITSQMGNQLFSFDDISLNILFDDNGIIEELNFGELFKGSTYSGIAIGDTIQKAIDTYGKPKTCTIKGAVWKNIAFFSKHGMLISSIRLRRSNFFDNTTTHEMRLSDSERKVLEMVRNKAQIPEVLGLDYTIYENGTAMGIRLGKTTREQVKEIMDKYSKGYNDLRSNSIKFIYDDISSTIIFDKDGIVSEINFGLLYKGKTSKGLSVGNTLDQAIEIYGEPKFRNFSNAIWDGISVFSEDSNTIDSIRIQLE